MRGTAAGSTRVDEALLGLVTGANIACGFHAGDPGIMRGDLRRRREEGRRDRGPGELRDLQGFGRRFVAYEPAARLVDDLLYQIGALEGVSPAWAAGGWSSSRAHGALYNVAATNVEHAGGLVDAVR